MSHRLRSFHICQKPPRAANAIAANAPSRIAPMYFMGAQSIKPLKFGRDVADFVTTQERL